VRSEPPTRGPRRSAPVQRLELAGVRRSAVVGFIVAILVPVAIVAWALLHVGRSASPARLVAGKHGHKATPQMRKTVSHTQNPILEAVAGANVSMTARGLLPPSTCMVMDSSMVTCTQPTRAVQSVTFRTYPSLSALYAAYMARAGALAQSQFRANFGDCSEGMTNGEVSWNHDFKHPRNYPVSQFIPAG
jgi:hypothetical protein